MSEEQTLIRSEAITKILEEKPSALLRWGTLFILLAITSIIVASWFIKYPDIVNSDVVITDATPPVPIIAKEQGSLSNIFVEEGDVMEKGQKIAIIKSAGSYEAIKEVEEILQLFQPFNATTYYLFDSLQFELNSNLKLGELDASFNSLRNALAEYKIEKESPETLIKISSFQTKIKNLRTLIAANKEKIATLERRVRVKEDLASRVEDDYVAKKINQDEYEKFITDYEDAKQDLISFQSSLESKELSITDYEAQINLIRQNDIKDNSLAFENIDEKTKYLKNQLDKWKENYLLVAPANGVISFYDKRMNEKKFFQKEEKIMAILPASTEELVGKVALDVRHNGKVYEDQNVLINLSSYPYQEFGKIRGKVRYKADIAKDNLVALEVELTNGLTTTNGKNIPQEQQLIGIAEIITEEKRLFQRIYEKVF